MGKHQHKQLHAAYLWEVKAAPEKKTSKILTYMEKTIKKIKQS